MTQTLKEMATSLESKVTSTLFPESQELYSNVPLPAGPTQLLINGCPVADNANSLTAGPLGPGLVEDIHLFQKMSRFNREKIPERIVHAHGSGCYGSFTATADISKYTMAKVFEKGTKTKTFVRFSTVIPEKGSPDMVRDPRGFSIKFYTQDGNWDLVANNTPVFFVRDAIQFPDVIHALGRDPRTNDISPISRWDFFSLVPESLHMVTWLYGDRGIPLSYRFMNGYGSNTFSLINAKGEKHFVKFHLLSKQGVKNFDRIQSGLLQGQDPNLVNNDLIDSIRKGEYPKWRFCLQIMTEEQAFKHPGAFDVTKVWSHKDFPLIEIGELELNKNVTDYFTEVEQVAFSPGNVVPGISFSPDKVLQGRVFSYEDAQRYRLGTNFDQLPVNKCPFAPQRNYYKGGLAQAELVNKFPSWQPNSFGGPVPSKEIKEVPIKVDGQGAHYPQRFTDEYQDFYKQPGDLFRLMAEDQKIRLVDAIATDLQSVPQFIVDRMLFHFHKADKRYGEMVERALKLKKDKTIKTEPERLKDAVTLSLQKGEKLESKLTDSLKSFGLTSQKTEVSL